jgi:surface antigen
MNFDAIKRKLAKKALLWVGGFLGAPAIAAIVVGLVIFVLVAGAIASGNSAAGSLSAAGQVGNCNLSNPPPPPEIELEPAPYKCQIYPTTTVPGAHYGVPYPVPGSTGGSLAADIQDFENNLPFQPATAAQVAFITECYSTWEIPTAYGGSYCGVAGAEHGSPGQCTFWALLNWNNPLAPSVTGNAAQFWPTYTGDGANPNADNAALIADESSVPTVGAMVVWSQVAGLYPEAAGHVAIVVAVEANTFVVSEMNWLAPWVTEYRVVSIADDPGVLGFLLPAVPAPGAGGTGS